MVTIVLVLMVIQEMVKFVSRYVSQTGEKELYLLYKFELKLK